MKLLHKYLYSLLIGSSLLASSCVDDIVPMTPEEAIDPELPEEIRNGYSVTFNINLNAMGDEGTSLSEAITNTYLREIENFVDLEKLRILFFTVAPDPRYPDDPEKTIDYFLFESKSRWVSNLTDKETTQADWQVTAPVFTYGNNDAYYWDAIRDALTKHPFKIAILANRPDNLNFGDFDDKFGHQVKFDTDRGPNWGPKDTYVYDESATGGINWRNDSRKPDVLAPENWDFQPIIHGLHHCQWDPIYTSKNNGRHVYDFIMEKPYADEPYESHTVNGEKVIDTALEDPGVTGNYNMMGALSYWAYKDENDKLNYYFHPSKTQGIPMYGVQQFDPITDWKAGTPFNVSYQMEGHTGTYQRKTISLLRSVAKIELKIPRKMIDPSTGEEIWLKIDNAKIHYTNVMARCEPLDVATPTDQLWKSDEAAFIDDVNKRCEWNNILDYGPIVFENHGDDSSGEYFMKRYAWFYGAWKDWWHFNTTQSKYVGPERPKEGQRGLPIDSKLFDNNSKGMPYPRIFNPVIQRNGEAIIKYCKIDTDPDYHYYVIYTGERNINDPSQVDNFTLSTGELVYFSFTVDKNDYILPLTDYSKNKLVFDGYLTTEKTATTYKENMPNSTTGGSKKEDNWNWPILRNHVYTITVTSFKDFLDLGGINSTVVSTENRTAPDLVYE